MTNITVSHPDGILHGTIRLPGSKSISNRALMLQHINAAPIALTNLSTADDTVLMQQALQQGSGTLHLKNAGTCMRFLTAFFAAKDGAVATLLCDERMEQRPIRELVDALRQLGADIEYLKTDGYPPLRIRGHNLLGGTVTVSAASSSQYVSALMMIAPLCEQGLTIHLTGDITSLPYIDMTASMMTEFGWNVSITGVADRMIVIPGRPAAPSPPSNDFAIEADWSAASYWYEMAALSTECNLLLEGLKLDSLQGDAMIHHYMEGFGVKTIAAANGIRLQKRIQSPTTEVIHLNACPDLAPALVVTAAALNTPIRFTGLQNLAVKESNRLEALHTELTKLGFKIAISADELKVNKRKPSGMAQPSYGSASITTVSTYADHRMAMAFAPLALVMEGITLEHPAVVEKSYPHFWEDLKRAGFRMSRH